MGRREGLETRNLAKNFSYFFSYFALQPPTFQFQRHWIFGKSPGPRGNRRIGEVGSSEVVIHLRTGKSIPKKHKLASFGGLCWHFPP